MQFSLLKANGRNLARGCAILIVAGAASGCSSQVARFNGVDDVFTASTDNQRSIIHNQQPSQPYPGDNQVSAAPVDGSHAASVSRSSLEPVSVQSLPPVAQSQPAPVSAQPARVAAPAPSSADSTMSTGTVAHTTKPLEPAVKPFKNAEPDTTAQPRMATAASEPKGWSRVGGAEITVKDGETVSNLSRRFGVPADVIMKTNGLTSANGLQAGQKIVIPTFSRKATASAPAGTTKVADAKSPTGSKNSAPAKVPLPTNAPVEKVAVLPQQPKVKDGKAAAQVDAAAAANQPKAKDVKPAPEAIASAAKPAKASGAAGSYTVAQGDTLSSIARRNGVGVTALKQANGLNDGLLHIGQTLKIPAAGAAAVASAKPAADPITTGATPPAKPAAATETLTAYTPPTKDLKVIQETEDEGAAAPNATGIGKMRWPVRGRVIANFGNGKDGDGIDIAVPEGTPVKAAENGVVIYAGDGLKEFGNTVLVRHENGLVTVYGHASSLEVTRGQKVKRGQEIALSGMSGTTDSPKLHFEVRKNSAPVDPSTFLE